MHRLFERMPMILLTLAAVASPSSAADAPLPTGVKAVWGLAKAYRETTPTSQRICINGLWRWQPANDDADSVPADDWGYCKVPGPWSANGQTLYPHPTWKDKNRQPDSAWYQREITIPKDWQGRRIAVYAEYLNSYAAVYLDGEKMGDMYFPSDEVDITAACRPGQKLLLSLYVKAVPLNAVMLAFTDTNTPKTVKGSVQLKGLCGDVFLVSSPAEARIADVQVQTSVRQWAITFVAALRVLPPDKSYRLQAVVSNGGKKVKEFTSDPFTAADVQEGRFSFAGDWKPDKLWDTHTPQNMYDAAVSLVDSAGNTMDAFRPVRFGFREFWIEGRDYYLNGTRFHSFVVPIDNAQLGAAHATYEACRETMLRQQSFGVNTVYTHNYGCEPGSHLSFNEFLRAADDVGMLVAMSQPHYRQYNWTDPDAEKTNGYARHAAFYTRMAGNHPAVVMYSMNHNDLGYSGSYNPDLTDGKHNAEGKIGPRTDKGALLGLKAQAIVEHFDPTRVVYHHSSGTLGNMHTLNLYLDFVPIQERSDWFELWAAEGTMPLMFCEYGVPWDINWTMYRGWYKGKRSWGSAQLPWEYCMGEWNSQFLGDRAFQLNEPEKKNLRWETKQWHDGKIWYKWDYPFNPSSPYSWGHKNQDAVWAMYIADNWRAFRTQGISARNAWGYSVFWELRDGVKRQRRDLNVDWDNLQKPGLSSDYIQPGNDISIDESFDRNDWIPTKAAEALFRNNGPLLAYIAGKPAHFTTKEHNYLPGQTVQKQIVVINDSRVPVDCDKSWSIGLPQPVVGSGKVTVDPGGQDRVPINFILPANLKPGVYDLKLLAKFSTGEAQEDAFSIHVLAPPPAPKLAVKTALFDPQGETTKLLANLRVRVDPVAADADLSGYDVLVVGKAALTLDGPAPAISRLRDGLKVIMFEQTADVLEKRFGFRVQEYGLRQTFARVPDHPLLAGLGNDNLRDWSGEATIMPSRLTGYKEPIKPELGPTIKWCGIELPRAYRAGNWGNVASVLIEKPANGNFLPVVDGGFSLQYSPLMEYREGKGLMLLCQMDVTGRSEDDPAAGRLVANMLNYVSSYSPPAVGKVVYVGSDVGRKHLELSGLAVADYQSGQTGTDQVLVITSGGVKTLTSTAVHNWITSGGRILAVGLDHQEANTLLPASIKMQRREYICSMFEPAAKTSPFAGIGPADVMNRDPRQLDLFAGGVTSTADGLLAIAPDGKTVFCQLVPWEFDYEKYYNLKRTYRRASYTLIRILGNLGVDEPTPLVERFSNPLPKDATTEGRWTTGFYLDKPQEFDDPYRYFQW